MRRSKIRFKYFTIPEWEKEQDYLRQQHNNGWKFTKVSFPGIYHFEACEPEDVIYQLDYNVEGRIQKEAYIQMFHDCGWEYMQDFVGYSYFRKPVSLMNGEEGIFCDRTSRLDMMKRVFKGRMIPLLILFFLVILPNIYIQSHINTEFSHILSGVFIVLLLVYVILFLKFGYQFQKYWKSL